MLVIDQFELASPGSGAILGSFRSTLKNNSASPVSVYIENLDLGRFRGPRFKDAVQAYFREKYEDQPLNVIVAVGSAALELVLQLHPQLWAAAPVIFAAVDNVAYTSYEALAALAEVANRPIIVQAETNLEVSPRDISEPLPRDVSLCLFRIAQESLRNTSRHAEASRAEVCLRRLDGGLQLRIQDNGTGFNSARQHRVRMSLGHASMRQRVAFVGGKIDIDSTPGHGTVVVAWVPLKGDRSEPSARAAG